VNLGCYGSFFYMYGHDTVGAYRDVVVHKMVDNI